MISKEKYDALRVELNDLRKRNVQSSYGLIPSSIEYLEQMLSKATSDEDRVALYALLVSECSRARNNRLYIDCLRRRAQAYPDDPIYRAGLAFSLATIESDNQNEISEVSKSALDLAKSQNRHVRYCATNMARIALLLNDYEMLKLALVELVADGDAERMEDTGLEFDFVDQINVHRIDADLLLQYKNLAN
jgi:hypothetical protein